MPLRFVSIKPHTSSTGTGTPPPSPPPTPMQVLMLDSRSTVGVRSSPLPAGPYIVTIAGTISLWNLPLTKGAPEPVAEYPTASSGRRSTEVGLDADTFFAQPAADSHPFGHWDRLEIDTGDGFAHLEPDGGPYQTPQPGHAYTYHLTLTGPSLAFRVYDPRAYADNYGQFHITIRKG